MSCSRWSFALAAVLVVAACERGGAPVATRRGAAPVDVVAHPNPLAALASADATLAANKRLVFDMWRSIVDAGHTEMADDLLAEGYIQHSPVLPTGRQAFKQIFSVVPRREIPELVEPPLVASVAEGSLVVMALLEKMPARDGVGAYATTHFNLFRVDGGRLAEHWHSVQTPPGPDVLLPEDGGPQPVKGASGEAQLALLAATDPHLAGNKRLVFDAWREVVEARRAEGADRYVATKYIEHSPDAGSGLEGFKVHFAAGPAAPVERTLRSPVVAVVAEGDLVVLVTAREHAHPSRPDRTYTTTWFDMFRVADGRLVEHWDAAAKTAAATKPAG
jgi:predicted SnoaL-like aldol condensation-catalyzing enzyme